MMRKWRSWWGAFRRSGGVVAAVIVAVCLRWSAECKRAERAYGARCEDTRHCLLFEKSPPKTTSQVDGVDMIQCVR